MERERRAAAAAEQEYRRGVADEALQPGTRVWLKADGEGTYERWQSSRFGANRHYIRLDSSGATKKVALKKLKPEEWAVLPESVESAPLESGQSATTQQQQAELAAGPPFTLTLKDMFGKMHTVQVSAGTKVFEVKERLRAAKGESVEYVDAMALLYNQGTLEDASTVGSHGLTESTTVTLSMSQDPERGRAMRRERGERALREVEEREVAEERRRHERERREACVRCCCCCCQREAAERRALLRKAKLWAQCLALFVVCPVVLFVVLFYLVALADLPGSGSGSG